MQMNEGEKYCKRLGFSTIVLHVEEGNENARRFYKKEGLYCRKQMERGCVWSDI